MLKRSETERSQAKETEAAADYWRLAEKELKRSIATAKSKERPKDISRQERAPVHYLLGYCQVNRYPTVARFQQRRMLREAKRQFETSYALDPTDNKAQRAGDKVREKMKRYPPDRPAELIGPVLVTVIALVLFIGAQVAKFGGWQEASRPEYKLTEAMLAAMPPPAQGPEAVLKELGNKLKPAFGKSFADKDSLLAHLTDLAGAQGVAQYGEDLAKYAFVPGALRHSYLSEGGWVLLTLGAALLLIAGLYLPYLTSLKVGPLHLEKSMAEQVGAGSALGITVERTTKGGEGGRGPKTPG